jgi:hypothetical protein
LTEEHRLRVFGNRVLRKIFRPKREEDRSWRKLHNDELHSLYSSPNIVRVIKSRRMRWAVQVARMGEGKGLYIALVERPEGKRPLGRPRHRWEDNIKMDLKDKGIGRFSWIRIGSSGGLCEHGNEPSGSIRKLDIFFEKLSDNQLFKYYSAPWSE